jgi:hypothetical protein
MKTVVLFTREQCHLCHVAHDVLLRVQRDHPFELVVVDLDREASPEQRAAYDHEVPVIEIDGVKAFKYRVDEARLVRLLSSALDR